MKSYNYSKSNFSYEEENIREKYVPYIANKIIKNYAYSKNYKITHSAKEFVIVSYDGTKI